MIVKADIETPKFRSHQHSWRFTAKMIKYREPKFQAYLDELQAALREQIPTPMPADTPLKVTLELVYPVKKHMSKKALAAMPFRSRVATIPDADNCAKGILDALQGIAYEDDRMIGEIHERRYREIGISTYRLRVTVQEARY